MTINEAAEILGVSVMTLRRRVAAGELTPLPSPAALKRPQKLLFRREDVERLQQKSEASSS